MTRLSDAALGRLPAGVGRPRYDRRGIRAGIVHLGIGAFHRAHQAVYTDALLRDDPAWGIVGASLRSPDTRNALAPQDNLYTLAVGHPDGLRLQVVGSVLETLVAPEDPALLLDHLTAPSTRIVSLTVTEKGYCHDPATGSLNPDHPDIRHDLAHPDRPRSALGYIVAGLARRRRAGAPPFTVLSCDNLPGNGDAAARLLAEFAALSDPALAEWIGEAVPCPNTMVDRIVPSTTEDDRRLVADLLGAEDAWPVMTEPFTQWVIEDRFASGRPAWEAAGAELVARVEPFERMKLRLLNGAHSAIAYLSVVAGIGFVADAVATPGMQDYLRALWAEAGATLDLPDGYDLGGYVAALERRFANPALRHRTAQIAMDGSQKLPQRLLAPIRDRLARNLPVGALALAVAAWMRHVGGRAEDGAGIELSDPLAARLAAVAAGAGTADDLAAGLLAVREIFGDDLPADRRFTGPLNAALKTLLDRGTRSTLLEVPVLLSQEQK